VRISQGITHADVPALRALPPASAIGLLRKRASRSLVQLQRLGLWGFYRATVDRAAGWDRPSPQGRKIALTRIDGIGDFLVWLGAAAAIRERFPAPDHRIVLIAERSFAPLA
jgi:hypothetical protein